jgi:hypothetical protein
MRNAIAMGLAPSANVFGTSAAALQSGIEQGFGQIPQGLLGEIEGLLRPTAERSKDILTADVLERGAATGQTRSSGTQESIARGVGDIENQLLQTVAAQLAPLTSTMAQAQLGGIGLGLGIPSQISSLLSQPVSEAFQATQVGLGLPGQQFGGAAGILGGLPMTPGTAPKGKGESAANLGGLAMMAASLFR